MENETQKKKSRLPLLVLVAALLLLGGVGMNYATITSFLGQFFGVSGTVTSSMSPAWATFYSGGAPQDVSGSSPTVTLVAGDNVTLSGVVVNNMHHAGNAVLNITFSDATAPLAASENVSFDGGNTYVAMTCAAGTAPGTEECDSASQAFAVGSNTADVEWTTDPHFSGALNVASQVQ